MAEVASDDGERARLERLASRAGRDELHEYVVVGRRNMVDLLCEFPSVNLSLAQVY